MNRLLDSLKRAVSKVPETAVLLLSGGIDSQAIAWLLPSPKGKKAITVEFEGEVSESPEALSACHFLGMSHEVVHVTFTRMFDLMEEAAVRFAGFGPIGGPGIIGYEAAANAIRSPGIVCTGTPGDELFCGYARIGLALGHSYQGYEPLEREMLAERSPRERWGSAVYRWKHLKGIYKGEVASIVLPKGDSATDLVEAEIAHTLPVSIQIENAVFLWHKLLPYRPFMDPDLVWHASKLEDRDLVGSTGDLKVGLRMALAEVLPASVRLNHVKKGMPIPFATACLTGYGKNWWKENVVGRANKDEWDLDKLAKLVVDLPPLPNRTLWTAAWTILVGGASK
jgi:asparagine synthetase B (glutamine-hydrolysing)